jgi:SAM-dependent methyltransferase
MDRSLFDSTELPLDRMARAASDLADKQWAGFCMDTGLRHIRGARAAFWVPRLTLVAASRLGRAAEVLPVYERCLQNLDSVHKLDWHAQISNQGAQGNLLDQSGRLAQTGRAFNAEFQRIVQALGPIDGALVVDVGCGGGLWALNLARLGYRVIATEHHSFLVEAARRNAAAAAVGDEVEFRVDDICNSALPAGLSTRALCIGVTPTLPDDAAFASLTHHLDRITRCDAAAGTRRVILGSNRWGPSRMAAVRGILDAASQDRQSASHRFAHAVRRLSLVEACWWLQPRHVEAMRAHFAAIQLIGETHDRIDGTRVDLLLS